MGGRSLKHELKSYFQVHGFGLKPEGCQYLEQALEPLDPEIGVEDGVIGVAELEEAIAECSQAGSDRDERLTVIDAFSVPRLDFDAERGKFLEPTEEGKPAPRVLHGTPRAKWLVHRNRFSLVHQRTTRHSIFTATAGAEDDASQFKLVKVEDIQASPKERDAVILGILTQLRGDKYYLEDETGSLELDLSEAKYHTGLICESAVVLVEGRGAGDSAFRVAALGFPPVEAAADTRRHQGDVNFFGGPHPKCASSSEKLRVLEAADPNAFFVFLSELWLDDPKVMRQFARLLDGYADEPPIAFVICGEFLSGTKTGVRSIDALTDGFRELAELIASHGDLAERTSFIFVPGRDDPVLGGVLPRPGIPESVVEPLSRRVPNCHFATNPCRIQYCTQEIVVFRENLVEKLCRNCIHAPSEKKDIPEHLVKTLQSQGHVAPLPLHVSPVFWDFEAGLRLYPLPDVLVVADGFQHFQWPEAEARVADDSLLGDAPPPQRHLTCNPGSFARAKFSFQCYYPARRELDDSCIPPE